MASFVFVTGILFGLHFVAYPCEGKITIINYSKYAVPGDNVTIEWNITNPIADVISRVWTFETTGETIASINDRGEVTIRDSRLPGVKVKPPSTLILENVDDKYNGTYSFLVVATTKGDTLDTSYVTVIVAGKPNVTINCSNPTIVDEDNDVRCLCKGEGGNPPAKVIWYDKNGGKIGVPGDEEKMLTLRNVDGTYNGTYKCVAQSYTLTGEKSIEVKVRPNFPPVVTRFTSKPQKAVLGESVTITCEADARPLPSYTIIYNDTIIVRTEETYLINVVTYSHAGSYKCIAMNKLGNSSKKYNLFIVANTSVTINCSNPTIVDEDHDVRCLCKCEGGNPPAKVIWYEKNGGKIGVPGDGKKMLTVSNVDGTYNGTYKCVAQSYELKKEKSIEVKVRPNFAPVITSFTSKPVKAVIGQSVTITCEASARPSPNYVIFHNGTKKYNGPQKTFTITNLEESDTGLYLCIAKNKLGTSEPKYSFVAVKEKSPSNKSNGGREWYIVVVSLLSGIVIGIILSYIFLCFRRRCRSKKPQSNPKPENAKVNSIYQDLDLSKMNSEDNYQSLRVNSGRNDADYQNQNDSTYTELNKVRDVENNYQSLT